MSLIAKALKKSQESRQQDGEYPKIVDIVYLTDTPKQGIKNILLVLIATSTIATILISVAALVMTMRNYDLKQAQVLTLENTVKIQEKRIDDFIAAINKNQKFTDSQIHDLNFSLDKESKDTRDQINILTAADSAHYDSLKEAILDGKQQVDSLDQYTKTLDQKIEALSASNDQAKVLTNPASGN